jgi:hypothetical protein
MVNERKPTKLDGNRSEYKAQRIPQRKAPAHD